KKVFAVPTEICEKYELEGKQLEAAQEALTPDVEGQHWDDITDSYGQTWQFTGRDSNNNRTYERTPWND
ncbi:MAG: hypothetical protein KAU22_11855, partial [Desulfuromonadales bacterium]|nr:hypothetical protein [Desulfuromonadales bacterium]